jgi:hypothetical protein
MSRQGILGGLFVVILLLVSSGAAADRVTWKDGRTAEGLMLSRGGKIHLMTGENRFLPLEWKDIESVVYSLPRSSGDFALQLEQSLKIVESGNLDHEALVAQLWKAAGCRENSLAEKDRRSFMNNECWQTRAGRLTSLLETLTGISGEYLQAGCLSEAVDVCYLTTWLGYRMQETGFPKRYELAFLFLDEGLKSLAPVLKASGDSGRNWNIIFAANRLYQAWGINAPSYPQDFIRSYAEQMEQSGVIESVPDVISFPAGYEKIMEDYIRQCHVWLEGDMSAGEKDVLKRRQTSLALDWVRLQKPGIGKENFLRLDEIKNRQERARSFAAIAYLTAESLLFKETGRRLVPGTQTNVPPPRDPFTGDQYRYLRGEPVDIIYSLGPDKKDQKAQVPFIPGTDSLRGDIYLIEKESDS